MPMFKRRSDRVAAVVLPVILGASMFMAPEASANHESSTDPSGYPLPHYYVEYEHCVRMRESNSHWWSRNPTRKYLGAYQMNQPLANGATYWMLRSGDIATYLSPDSLKEQRAFARELRATSVHKWDPWLQTSAFRRTLDGHHANRPWAGKFHWYGGRWTC